MAEYIEREALIADIENRYCRPCEAEGKDYNHVRCRACWVDDMVGEIGEAPFAADVAPVVRVRCEKGCVDEWYTNVYTCMGCGVSMMLCDADDNHIAPRLCANCGAKMGGE